MALISYHFALWRACGGWRLPWQINMILLFVLASCAAEFYRVDLVLLLAWLVGRLIEAALWSLCFDGEVSSGSMIFTRYDFVTFEGEEILKQMDLNRIV